MSRIVLLGPQQFEQTAGQTLKQLGISGRVAMITAGWQEWEADDQPLSAQLGVETVNLGLYARGDAVWSADPELRTAHTGMQDRLRQLRRLYNRRLAHLAADWLELLAEEGPEEMLGPERAQALASIQALDAHHIGRITEITSDFEERFALRERPTVQKERSEIERTLNDCEAVVIEGGHVAVLRNRMRLFSLPDLLGERTVLACSGGAMVLGERIVLFHDSPPSGPGHTEVALTGLATYSGLVVLPHARTRLRLDQKLRVVRLARRFAPDRCVILEAGTRIDWDSESREWSPVFASRLDPSGTVQQWEAVA